MPFIYFYFFIYLKYLRIEKKKAKTEVFLHYLKKVFLIFFPGYLLPLDEEA